MKTLSSLLLLSIVLALCGCDNPEQPKPNKEPPPAPTVPKPQVN